MKLIPAFRIGKRNGENTSRSKRDVARRLHGFGTSADPFDAIPMSELRGAGCRPMVSTDGFVPYLAAVEDACGCTADHGVMIKALRRRCRADGVVRSPAGRQHGA
jgi:hypothetical protein